MSNPEELLNEIEEMADGIEKSDKTGNSGVVKAIDDIFKEAEEKTKLDTDKIVGSVGGLTEGIEKQAEVFERSIEDLKDGFVDLTEAVKDRPEVIKTIVQNPTKFPDFPKEFKVSNLKEIPLQKEVEVKEPSWLKKLINGNILKDIYSTLKAGTIDVRVLNDDPKRPISVRLSNGRKFYNAIFSGLASSGIIPFVDSSGNRVSPLVDGDKHLQTDVLNKLVPENYDYLDLTMTGSNLTGVVYKSGGAGGTTVATLALTYDGSDNLDTVTKI